MHAYLYFHISGINMCVLNTAPINLHFCSHFPLYPSKSLQAQELHDLLTPGHLFYFLDPCKMLCQQWALHQDMFASNVAKVFKC